MGIESEEAADAQARFASARAIFVGLALSPLVFAASAWIITEGGTEPSGTPGILWWLLWAFFTVEGVVMWHIFRRKAVAPVTEWPGHRRRAENFTAATLQTYLIIAWAGAEVVGLAGGIAFIFTTEFTMLGVSLVTSLVCLALSAPRREWFRTLEGEARAAGAP